MSFSVVVRGVTEDGAIREGDMGAWLDSPPPAVLVPGGLADGGFSEFRAQFSRGRYFAPGVPEGTAYVHFNDVYLVTDEREVSFDAIRIGRLDLNWSVPSGTDLQLRATGLAPWQPSDGLRLSSPNNSTPMMDRRLDASAPSEATQLEVRVAPFSTLIDGNAGDSLWVHQMSVFSNVAGGGSYTATVRGFHQPAFSLVPGATATLDAAMTEGAQREVRFTVDTGAFEAAVRAGHPDTELARQLEWGIGARPGAEPIAALDSSPELAYGSAPIGALEPYAVRFLDDFPGHWQRVAHISVSAVHPVSVPGSHLTWSNTLHLQRADTLAGWMEAGTLAPRLGPVRNIRINGQPASGPLTGVGDSPLVSWEPPSLGTPTRYFVQVAVLSEHSGTEAVLGRGSVVTSGTEVRLPPRMVPSSGHFIVKVTATRGAGVRSPYEGLLPRDMAEAATGALAR